MRLSGHKLVRTWVGAVALLVLAFGSNTVLAHGQHAADVTAAAAPGVSLLHPTLDASPESQSQHHQDECDMGSCCCAPIEYLMVTVQRPIAELRVIHTAEANGLSASPPSPPPD